MSAAFSMASLKALAQSFRKVKAESFHRQMGRRYCKDALALGDRNLSRSQELYWKAAFHLPYAQAMDDLAKDVHKAELNWSDRPGNNSRIIGA